MSPLKSWKLGTPISEAWWEYSSDELYRKYNRPKLSKTISPKTGVGMLIKQLADHPNRSKLTKSLIRTQHTMEFHSHRTDIRREMEKDVVRQLQVGTLAAYGYLVGGTVKAPPIEIPERFFELKFIKWDLETISAPPHEFTSVRVVNTAANHKIRQPTKPPTSAKRGRPSVRDKVIAAMTSLAEEHLNVTFEPHKKWVPIIRERIHKTDSDDWAPDKPADRTIMRIIPVGRKAIRAVK
jgi:hypothetical protein